jgi:hypothetical protein
MFHSLVAFLWPAAAILVEIIKAAGLPQARKKSTQVEQTLDRGFGEFR